MCCALWWTRWRLRNGWDSSEPGLARVVNEAHLQLINPCLYSCVSLGADRRRLLAASCQRPAEDLDPSSHAINDTPTLGCEKRNFTCVQVNSSTKYQHWIYLPRNNLLDIFNEKVKWINTFRLCPASPCLPARRLFCHAASNTVRQFAKLGKLV